MYPRKIKSVSDEVVVFTGSLPGMTQAEAKRWVQRSGGEVRENSTLEMTLLVRGTSSSWQYREFGIKEDQASRCFVQGGLVVAITAHDFVQLVENGKPATSLRSIAGIPVEELLSQRDVWDFENGYGLPAGKLERPTSTISRVEQAKLRSVLLDGLDEAECAICGKLFPSSLLISAHLKRRSDCSRAEKADIENIALLMCRLGCDSLYELGYISIDDDARLIVSKNGVSTSALKTLLGKFQGRQVKAYRPEHEQYLAWHREFVFLG